MNPGSPLIKVCGLTDVDQAVACARLGADWIGLNFHPASPRSISPGRAAEIAAALDGKAEAVGLFVDRAFDEMAATVEAVGLRTIQLHGDEDVDYLDRCLRDLPDLKVIRAYRLSSLVSVERMVLELRAAADRGCPPYAILVDAHVPGQPGGTGRSISDSILDSLPDHPRLILAGGLTPENVAERVAKVQPWMVDVASGVESSPGVKDLDRVAAFVAAAREENRSP